MIPENTLSTTPVRYTYLTPVRNSPFIDYEWGGAGVRDTYGGLYYKVWHSEYKDNFIILTDGNTDYPLLEVPNVDYISFAFDQNMQPCIAYVQEGKTYFWYYSTVGNAHVLEDFGEGLKNPQVTLDDHRPSHLDTSDIIFSYMKGDNLYFRVQRERYLQEHFVAELPNRRLIQSGMTRGYRFQWRTVFDN